MEIGTWLDPLLSPAQWHGMAQARTLFGKITFWPSVAYLCVAKGPSKFRYIGPFIMRRRPFSVEGRLKFFRCSIIHPHGPRPPPFIINASRPRSAIVVTTDGLTD